MKPKADKQVTWVELFFDLVFVFAVTQLSDLLHRGHGWGSVGQAVVVLVPTYWAWVGMAVHANTRDVNNTPDRLGILALSLCGLFMALATPLAYEERGLMFGAAYFAQRSLLAALYFRGRPFELVNPFTLSVCVTGPLLLAGGLLDSGTRVWVWAAAAAIDLAAPVLTRSHLVRVNFHPHHLPERFGLLLIIAMGEPILAIGAQASAARPLAVGSIGAVAATFVLACALWWVYFIFAAESLPKALDEAVIRTDLIRRVFSYGHLAFIGSIMAMAVGMAEVVSHPGQVFAAPVTALLFGGCALYFATFCYARWHIFGKWSGPQLAMPVASLAIIPIALQAPALLSVAALVLVVMTFNFLEHSRARSESDALT
ncbi:low temperature requirement protein A [Nonomuraea sp. NPDC049684]|uniref:low temperature requirement protein A n=1 Tax=unclassified Nonomuraea TaxID=2593643 RepID=UPI0037910DD1